MIENSKTTKRIHPQREKLSRQIRGAILIANLIEQQYTEQQAIASSIALFGKNLKHYPLCRLGMEQTKPYLAERYPNIKISKAIQQLDIDWSKAYLK